MPAVVAHRSAVGQDEVDALRAVERAAAAERDDAVDASAGRVLAPRLDHVGVGVRAELVKEERHDADGVQQRRRAIHQAGRDNSFVGDDQRAREPELGAQQAKLIQRAVSKDDAGSQCEIKRSHGR